MRPIPRASEKLLIRRIGERVISRVLDDPCLLGISSTRFRIRPKERYQLGLRAGIDEVIACGVLVPSRRGPLLRVELKGWLSDTELDGD